MKLPFQSSFQIYATPIIKQMRVKSKEQRNPTKRLYTIIRYVNRFFYGPFILHRHFQENLRMTFQTEIDKKFCDTCQI